MPIKGMPLQTAGMTSDDGAVDRGPADDALLTPERMAELLGVSTVTLARWRRSEGAGPPFVRISTIRVGYPIRAFRTWLAAKIET